MVFNSHGRPSNFAQVEIREFFSCLSSIYGCGSCKKETVPSLSLPSCKQTILFGKALRRTFPSNILRGWSIFQSIFFPQSDLASCPYNNPSNHKNNSSGVGVIANFFFCNRCDSLRFRQMIRIYLSINRRPIRSSPEDLKVSHAKISQDGGGGWLVLGWSEQFNQNGINANSDERSSE